jgi:hypothetical protein
MLTELLPQHLLGLDLVEKGAQHPGATQPLLQLRDGDVGCGRPGAGRRRLNVVRRSLRPGFFYRSVYLYRCGAVRVYRSGINGIPLLTARIQIPNQNHLFKRYRAVYRGINGLYCGINDFYHAVNNLYRCTEKDPPTLKK